MSERKVRQRRWLAATGATACVLASGLFYLKSAASNKAWAEGRSAHPNGFVEPSQEQKEVNQALLRRAVSRAETLRAKMRPWALRNKALLQRALDAQPGDRKALMDVYTAVPWDARQVGLSDKEDLGGADPPFSWGTIDKMLTPAQIAERSAKNPMIRRSLEHGRRMRAQNFGDLRDVEVSSSVNSGELQVQLWSSGRITYTRASRQLPKPGRYGQNLTMAQIAPPHDFLQDSIHPEVGVESVPEPTQEGDAR